jgi:hypothetical protein
MSVQTPEALLGESELCLSVRLRRVLNHLPDPLLHISFLTTHPYDDLIHSFMHKHPGR